ncbi:hypothetical protein [Rahnella inusitata]
MENVLPVTVATERLYGRIPGLNPALDKNAFTAPAAQKTLFQ